MRAPGRTPRARYARLGAAALALAPLLAGGCGYQIANRVNTLPGDVHVVAVLPFENHSRTPQLSQSITAAVAHELVLRGRYRVQPTAAGADAVLHGNVISATVTPVTFDQVNGRATLVDVVVHVQAWLTDTSSGKELFRNNDMVFHDQYALTEATQDFFQEETSTLTRLSQTIAQTLVSDILEGF